MGSWIDRALMFVLLPSIFTLRMYHAPKHKCWNKKSKNFFSSLFYTKSKKVLEYSIKWKGMWFCIYGSMLWKSFNILHGWPRNIKLKIYVSTARKKKKNVKYLVYISKKYTHAVYIMVKKYFLTNMIYVQNAVDVDWVIYSVSGILKKYHFIF